MSNHEIEGRIRCDVDFLKEEFKASFTVKLEGSILTREIFEIRSQDELTRFKQYVLEGIHRHLPHLSVEDLRDGMEWGDVEIDKLEADGDVLSLHHLSKEFNEARQLPRDQRDEVRRNLVATANSICQNASESGLLTSSRSLNKYLFECTDDDKQERLFDLLIGYSKVTGEGGPTASTKHFPVCYYLFPGLLAAEGLMPDDEIPLGMNLTDDEITNAISEHSFRVMGFCSKGCEAIAEGSYGNPGRFCFGVGFRGIVASWVDLMVLGYPLRLLRSVAKDGSHAFAFDG